MVMTADCGGTGTVTGMPKACPTVSWQGWSPTAILATVVPCLVRDLTGIPVQKPSEAAALDAIRTSGALAAVRWVGY
jgi:hypothetical protein